MATTDTFVPGRLYEMPLADLQPDPNQPRKYIDPAALDELTASIKQQGVVSPILFRVENGIAYVIAGERRCIAARRAGLTTIPAIYLDNPNYEEIALIENTVRADLTAVEEAEALERLRKSRGYKQEDLARMIGKTVASISQTLSLNRLPQTILDECRKNPAIPKHVLIEIAVKKQERSMIKAYEAYKASINPEKKSKTGETVTQAQRTVNAMDAMGRKIEAIEPRNLLLQQKRELIAALKVLKGIVVNGVAKLTEDLTGEPPEEDASEEDAPQDETSADESSETTPPEEKPKILS
jgi:ParB family transcriptional regulator, chromosome partitioning protein